MAKKQKTLRKQVLQLILVGCFLPFLAIMIVSTGLVRQHVAAQTQRTISNSMDKAVEICSLRLEDCVKASKDLSYLPYLRTIYDSWKKSGDDSVLYADTTSLLRQLYKYNDSFRGTMLTYTEKPDRCYYTSDRSSSHAYETIHYYEQYAAERVLELSAEIDTNTVFERIGTHVYMVRNVMTKNFEPYAVLVMDLNCSEIFDSLKSVWEYTGMEVRCDGVMLYAEHFSDDPGEVISRTPQRSDQSLSYAVAFDKAAAEMEARTLQFTMVALILCLIPVMVLILHFLDTRVTEPVSKLGNAAEKIRAGELGAVVEVPQRDDEVTNLMRNFNGMSERLKSQFDRIYVEEIALRDANIHALQSQINPHFLNNTLEIINWDCRLGGNEKASLMIEALSTMMNATLDREKKPLIPLSEEMEYIEAYIYIISCRFGEKFSYEAEVDQSLMNEMIPRLIIQPIIENAVEHGVAPDGSIRVSLRIYRFEEEVRIEVRNQGIPTIKDRRRIAELLGSVSSPTDVHHSEIGIRNVHRRLRILFGEDSGLEFTTEKDRDTVCTIHIHTGECLK